MEDFLQTYGIIAAFLGMFIEGEIVLIAAGFLWHQGYFHLASIFLVLLVGALLVDMSAYGIGRAGGEALRKRFVMIDSLLHKTHKFHIKTLTTSILLVRYLYGTRNGFFFSLGSSRIGFFSFLWRDILAIISWVTTYLILGYFFGGTLSLFVGKVTRYHREIMILIISAAGIIFVIVYLLFPKIKEHLGKIKSVK